MDKRNSSIDFVKWIMSVLVISLHTRPFQNVSFELDFFLTQGISRVAVPFFLVCTGFFIGKRINEHFIISSGFKSLKRSLLKTSFKYFKLYFSCALLYLILSIPGWINSGWFSAKAFFDWMISFFLIGSYYHLWYLLSTCIAILIIAFISPVLKKKRFIIMIMIPLWLIGIIDYSYYWLLSDSTQTAIDYLNDFSVLFSGVFRVLPLILAGIVISKFKILSLKNNIIGFVVTSVLMTAEVFFLSKKGVKNFGYILLTLPLAFFFFNLVYILERYFPKHKIFTLLAKISMINYCIHPAIILLLDSFFTLPNWLKFALVVIISNTIALLYYKLRKNISSYKVRIKR